MFETLMENKSTEEKNDKIAALTTAALADSATCTLKAAFLVQLMRTRAKQARR